MNPRELTGLARTHVAELSELAGTLHVDAVAAFRNLHREAGRAGFALTVVSSFRDFERQLKIWNGKFRGDKPLLDGTGRSIDPASLTVGERVAAILRWSALPGASRHHWGTDLDLMDANAVEPGYRVQLVPAEFAPGGPFARLARWLEDNAPRYGFFRPYRGALSGVAAEPWHWSFAPVAEMARRALTPEVLRAALARSELSGREVVLAQLEELHARYVTAIDWP